MKYLNHFDSKGVSFSLGTIRKSKYLKESTHILDEERIIEEIPITINSVVQKDNRTYVKYDSDVTGFAREWVFSYKESTPRNNEYTNYSVDGAAILLKDKKVIRFEKDFGSIEEAKSFYERMKKKYPQSQISIKRKRERSIKTYV